MVRNPEQGTAALAGRLPSSWAPSVLQFPHLFVSQGIAEDLGYKALTLGWVHGKQYEFAQGTLLVVQW